MIKLLITGDFCIHDRMQKYDSSEIVAAMSSVTPYIKEADYAITNLESAVFDGVYKPITKCGPNLSCSSESVKAINELGFKGVTLANNHIADFGSEALDETLRTLEHYGIDYFGAGRNLKEASQIMYISINGKKIAIINCCENEYTIATETAGGANPLDVVTISRAIKEAISKADYTIVIVHGGTEHYNLPTPRMQKWYRFFVEEGADVVINHHQHCYSGYEIYEGKPIVYGLGNFCFDCDGLRGCGWNKGYMVQVELDKDVQIELIPYEQCDEKAGTYVLNQREEFDKNIRVLNSIIFNEAEVYKRFEELVVSKKDEYTWIFDIQQNRALRRLAKKGLLPKKFAKEVLPATILEDKEKFLTLLSYFQCEAHHDVMAMVLKNQKAEI